MVDNCEEWICINCKHWEEFRANEIGCCTEVNQKGSLFKIAPVTDRSRLETKWNHYCGSFDKKGI